MPIDLTQDYKPSPDWWLTNITEDQFRLIYAGTPGMQVIDLFRAQPGSDADYFNNYFPSKLFRLCSGLYVIENKSGNKMPFEMNYAQHIVYAASLRHSRIIVLKSRQQGISTLWLLSYIDDGITNDSFAIGLMSQGKKESQTLLSRTTVALEGLPGAVVKLLGISVIKNNSEAISFSNGSIMYIQTSFRSGTLQRLHISEMGKISAKYPEKARETKSGSLQAIAPGNTVVVESTAEGRKNEFYKMWHEAADYVGARTGMDFYPVFLSWVDDPDCNIDIAQKADAEAIEYFVKCEHNVNMMRGTTTFKLSDKQKWWWIAKKRELPEDIFQEYPATPDEAFAAVRDGAYYAVSYTNLVKDKQEIHLLSPDEIAAENKLTTKSRSYTIMCRKLKLVSLEPEWYELTHLLYDKHLPVYASCDLGKNDMWVTIYFQVHSDLNGKREWRVIGCYGKEKAYGLGIQHYVDEAKSRPYRIARWYLPHDANVEDLSADKSRADIFRALGCKVKVLRVTSSVNNDISICRANMPMLWIDTDEAELIVDMMYNYSKEWDSKGGCWKDRPLHDLWSNPADGFRYMVLGYNGGVGATITQGAKPLSRKPRRRRGGSIAV